MKMKKSKKDMLKGAGIGAGIMGGILAIHLILMKKGGFGSWKKESPAHKVYLTQEKINR